MKNSIEAPCSVASLAPVEIRMPSFAKDEEPRFEEHLGVELGLAPRARVVEEPDSKEARSTTDDDKPTDDDVPRDEGARETYTLPRPELLLAAVATGENAHRGGLVADPVGKNVGAAPSNLRGVSESGSANSKEGGARVASVEPAKSLDVAEVASSAATGGTRAARIANAAVRLASGGMVSAEKSAPPKGGETSSRPLDAAMRGTTDLEVESTNGGSPTSGPWVESDRSRTTHLGAPAANGSPAAERPNDASPRRGGVELALENQPAETHDGPNGADPSTLKLVLSGANAENGAVAPNVAHGRTTEGPFERPRATEPVESQPGRIMQPVAPPGEGASIAKGLARDGQVKPKNSPDLARSKEDVPTAPLAGKRTLLDANPNEINADKTVTTSTLSKEFVSSTGARALEHAPTNSVQRTGRAEAILASGSTAPGVASPAEAGTPRGGPPRKRHIGVDEGPNGTRTAAKPLASSEEVSAQLGGGGMERGVPDASAGPGRFDVNRSASVKPMTVEDRAELRSADEANGAVRVAEAVGHRRALAGEAHGSVTLEHVGRFEVRARPHEGGRVEVHVHAEQKAGSTILGAHATELRADLRAAIPHATVDVATPETAGASYGPRERSSGGDASRDPRDRPTSTGGVLSAEAEQPLTASWNRRNARVRIVL